MPLYKRERCSCGKTATRGPHCQKCFEQELACYWIPKLRDRARRWLHRGLKDLADDMAIDSLLACYVRCERDDIPPFGASYDDPESFRPFLIGAVKNLCLAEDRKRRRRHEHLERLAGTSKTSEPSPDGLVSDRELAARCRKACRGALAYLPRGARKLVLWQARGRSYEWIAERLGIPIGTVRSRLSRARDKFPNLMRRAAVSQLPRPICRVYALLERAYALLEAGRAFDLRLIPPLTDAGNIPDGGKNQVVVAAVNKVLHFRAFDGKGRIIVAAVEGDERLIQRTQQIGQLNKQLEGLWPPSTPNGDSKRRVTAAVVDIVGLTPVEVIATRLGLTIDEVRRRDDRACDHLKALKIPLPKRRVD